MNFRALACSSGTSGRDQAVPLGRIERAKRVPRSLQRMDNSCAGRRVLSTRPHASEAANELRSSGCRSRRASFRGPPNRMGRRLGPQGSLVPDHGGTANSAPRLRTRDRRVFLPRTSFAAPAVCRRPNAFLLRGVPGLPLMCSRSPRDPGPIDPENTSLPGEERGCLPWERGAGGPVTAFMSPALSIDRGRLVRFGVLKPATMKRGR